MNHYNFNTQADAKLKVVLDRLIPRVNPLAVYLFGSMARGDSGADSDYDLLFLVRDDAPPECKSHTAAYQALRGTGIAADVLIWTKSEFNRRLHIPASLPATVKREGRLLYGQ